MIEPTTERKELLEMNSYVLSELETEIDSKLHIA
jgi:hypothetical protein